MKIMIRSLVFTLLCLLLSTPTSCSEEVAHLKDMAYAGAYCTPPMEQHCYHDPTYGSVCYCHTVPPQINPPQPPPNPPSENKPQSPPSVSKPNPSVQKKPSPPPIVKPNPPSEKKPQPPPTIAKPNPPVEKKPPPPPTIVKPNPPIEKKPQPPPTIAKPDPPVENKPPPPVVTKPNPPSEKKSPPLAPVVSKPNPPVVKKPPSPPAAKPNLPTPKQPVKGQPECPNRWEYCQISPRDFLLVKLRKQCWCSLQNSDTCFAEIWKAAFYDCMEISKTCCDAYWAVEEKCHGYMFEWKYRFAGYKLKQICSQYY